MADILILRGDKPNAESEAYKTVQGLRELGLDTYELVHYRNITFEITDTRYAVWYETKDGPRDLASFDLVYIRDYHGYEPERNCTAHYLQHKGKKFLNTDVGTFQHLSKLTQYAQFAVLGIPIPYSMYVHTTHIAAVVQEYFSYPVVIKSIVAKSGEDNYLVRSEKELQALLPKLTSKYVIQSFVPNDGDYRYIVLGNQVSCVYRRMRVGENEHRNNVSQGGEKTYLALSEVPAAYKALAVKAAQAVNREICGVDVMINKDSGKPLILEANFNFGIRAVPGMLSEEVCGLADYLHAQAS